MPGVRSATYLCASIYTYYTLWRKKSQIFTDLLKKFICFDGFFLLIDASVAS